MPPSGLRETVECSWSEPFWRADDPFVLDSGKHAAEQLDPSTLGGDAGDATLRKGVQTQRVSRAIELKVPTLTKSRVGKL